MRLVDFILKDIYVLVKPNHITVKNLKTNQELSVDAEEPFCDGRQLIADFEVFDVHLKNLTGQLFKKGVFIPNRFRMHVEIEHEFETPISEVELRAVRDSAEHAGARELYLKCDGKDWFA